MSGDKAECTVVPVERRSWHWRQGDGSDGSDRDQRRTAMPTIASIGSIQIRIYYDDHGAPHFHAISPEFDVKITIADCSIVSGNGRLRGRDLAAIRAWGQRHRDALYRNWQLAREGRPLQDIGD